jgi:hypothetical protein
MLGVRKKFVCYLLLYLSSASGLWAEAFQDLDFESATLVPISGDPFNRVDFSMVLPGWNGFSGTNQLNAALYDNVFLDSTGIGIIDTNAPASVTTYISGVVIQGNYTAFLEAGLQLGSSSISVDASLSQTGVVPSGTKSLSFLAFTNGPFAVSLGGTNLNLISSPVAGQNYTLFQADISEFAGQTAELDFTVFAANPYNGRIHSLVLDDIQFSPTAIPEPGAISYVMAGIVAFGIWRLSSRNAG